MTQTATTPANYPRTVADVIVRPDTAVTLVRAHDAYTVTLPVPVAQGIALFAALGAYLCVAGFIAWGREKRAAWGKP